MKTLRNTVHDKRGRRTRSLQAETLARNGLHARWSVLTFAFLMATVGPLLQTGRVLGQEADQPQRRRVILQFTELPSVDELLEADVRPLNYVSEDTIVASVPTHMSGSLTSRSGKQLRRVVELEPADRISPTLLSRRGRSRSRREMAVVVEAFSDVRSEALEQLIAESGGVFETHPAFPDHIRLAIGSSSMIERLSRDNRVAFIGEADERLLEGEPLHYCEGPLTAYGPIARFATVAPGWDGPGLGNANLTYFFENGTPDIAGSQERNAVLRAFAVWSRYANVTFAQTVAPNLNRSIDIRWDRGAHGDGFPFDGNGPVLAHAFFPSPAAPETNAGDMHFDDDENWSLTGDVDQFTVALHEAGHALGLRHSPVPGAVMAAFYGGPVSGLADDDILGIQSLYAIGEDLFRHQGYVLGDGSGVHTYPALTGYVNDDDKTDLIFIGQNWSGPGLNIRTKLSNGDGTWKSKSQVLGDGSGIHSYPALTGDVNDDGKTDLIFVGQNWSGPGLNIRVKLSNGDGTWTSRSQVLGDGSGIHRYPALAGDVNDDGKTDLIFVGQNWSGPGLNIRVKLSNGDGTWTSRSQVLGDGSGIHSYPALTGHVNDDDKTDLIFIGQNWSGPGLNIRVKLSNGDGTWTSRSQVLGDGSGIHSYPALTADVNEDGRTDLIFVGQNWSGSGLNIRTKLSNGNGTWTSKSQVMGDGSGIHSYPALTGYFNDDDKADLVFVGQGWNGLGLNIRVKQSNGDGTYAHRFDVQGDGSGVLTYPTLTGDVNGDGKTDLIFVGQNFDGPGLNVRTKFAK